MKWIFKYLAPMRTRITVGIFIKTIGTFAELMIPFLLSYILEFVIKKNDINKILSYGALMAVCAVVAFGIKETETSAHPGERKRHDSGQGFNGPDRA